MPLRREFRVKHAKQPENVRWYVQCANLSRRSCDLSQASLYYWGKYLVRVRAEANGSHSEWVELIFHPDRHGEELSVGLKVRLCFRCSSVCPSSQGGSSQQSGSVPRRKYPGRPHP